MKEIELSKTGKNKGKYVAFVDNDLRRISTGIKESNFRRY